MLVHVDASDVMGELDTDELAKELVSRGEWQHALDRALGKQPIDETTLKSRFLRMVDKYQIGESIEHSLREITWDFFGRAI